MAFANSTISDVIATTARSRSKKASDNLTNNDALLRKLKERGNAKPVTGGSSILQELFYNDPATNFASSYSGSDVISIATDSPISAAEFILKNYADAVTINGPEELQNSGKEKLISLLATRIEIAQARLSNKINSDLYLNGTGNSGKDIVGLAAAISQTPTTGVYGGIDRATWAFWRNTATTATALVGGVATSATIQSAMNQTALQVVRETDHADLIVAGSTVYSLYQASLQAIQRVTDDKMGAAGFSSLKFYGGAGAADVCYGGGIGATMNAQLMYFINTNFFHFRTHPDRNFTAFGGDKSSVNQDVMVQMIGWSGALTCSGSQFQAVLSNT